MHVCHISTEHTLFHESLYQKECWSVLGWADRISVINQERPHFSQEYSEIDIFTYPKGLKFRRLLSYLRDVAVELQADIYHLHHPWLLALLPSLRKHTHAAVIYDMHTPYPEYLRTFSGNTSTWHGLKSDLMGIWERSMISRVDGAIFHSDRLYESIHASNNFSTLLYDFPRLEYYSPAFHQDQEDFNVLYTGLITEPHGILYLIEAFYYFYQREQHGELYIVGDIYPPEFQEVLHQAIRYFSLSHAVHLEPRYTNKELLSHLRSASVGVSALLPLPFFRKSLQSNIFDYMASGIPVVAGASPANQKFIRRAKSGIVLDEPSPVALANALSFLHNHPHERNIMGERGREITRKQQNWNAMRSKLQNFYARVFDWRQTMEQ
ncbi:MAG: glycosyltransferase [Calditrichota bacterium]